MVGPSFCFNCNPNDPVGLKLTTKMQEVFGLVQRTKSQVKKPPIYSLLLNSETKKKQDALFLPFFNWGIVFVLLVKSKCLELKGCGLRHLVRNLKQFQNLTDFYINFLFLTELLLKMPVDIHMFQIVTNKYKGILSYEFYGNVIYSPYLSKEIL